MTLTEMAVEYRQGAAQLQTRIKELTVRLDTTKMREMDKLRLRIRIETLRDMYYDMSGIAGKLERYYDVQEVR